MGSHCLTIIQNSPFTNKSTPHSMLFLGILSADPAYSHRFRGQNIAQHNYCVLFDPSILRHSGIWGAENEAVLNKIQTLKNPKNPPVIVWYIYFAFLLYFQISFYLKHFTYCTDHVLNFGFGYYLHRIYNIHDYSKIF